MKTKKVYFVGAGPGRKDLITVRAYRILKEAETIIYDYLVNPEILEVSKPKAELINACYLDKTYNKNIMQAHRNLGELIARKAKQGKKVLRLKNGTPTIFGRFAQELEPLIRQNINFEIIPGITASNAASCYTGVPLTDRRFASGCVLVTGKEAPGKKETLIDWQALSKARTIVLYMAVGNLGLIVKILKKYGRQKDTPVCLIKDASLWTQKTISTTLGELVKKVKQEKIKPPAIVIIGEVCKLEKRYNWFGKTKKVLYTGLSEERFYLDEFYFHIPFIRIVPMNDYTEFDNYLKKIDEFDWIVFTSRYGVKYFFERLTRLGFDSRKLFGLKIAAIGNSTAGRLKQVGIIPDLVPKQESSVGLITEFKKLFSLNPKSLPADRQGEIRNPKIFLPRSDLSDKGLADRFRELGAEPTTVFAYRNIMPEKLPDLNLDFFDEIMFTSPSTVRNFKKRYGNVPDGIKIRCIGDVTSAEVDRQGLRAKMIR